MRIYFTDNENCENCWEDNVITTYDNNGSNEGAHDHGNDGDKSSGRI